MSDNILIILTDGDGLHERAPAGSLSALAIADLAIAVDVPTQRAVVVKDRSGLVEDVQVVDFRNG